MTLVSQGQAYSSVIDDRTKLAWLAVLVIDLFLFIDPVLQFSVLVAISLFAWIAGKRGDVDFKAMIIALKVLGTMLVVVVIVQAFVFSGDTLIFSFDLFQWTLRFTVEGAIFGLVVASRFVSISIAFMMFFMTTSAYKLCRSLYKLRVPYKYAYLFPMALDRFPRMVELMNSIETAQATRGFELETGSIWQKIKNILPIMIPLVIISLREAGNMSVALELRRFGLAKEVTFFHDQQLTPLDKWLLSAAGATLVFTIGLKLYLAIVGS